jgi:hypothetical protein
MHPFAPAVICSYCGALIKLDESSVEAETFHKTFIAWNAPQSYGLGSYVSLGEDHWAVEELLARGEVSQVHAGRRARWPTELVTLKFLHNTGGKDLFENEWRVLQKLHKSQARGAESFRRLLPQPVAHGRVSPGQHAGESLSIFRREMGFRHTFEQVHKAYPQGIPPRASLWVWRRILEVLSFIHASGLVHAAVLPPHLMIQENEHGLRLVGYGRAGEAGGSLSLPNPGFEGWYLGKKPRLEIGLDIRLSACSMAYLLGGDPPAGELPASVPQKLAGFIQRVIKMDPTSSDTQTAWNLREELGQLADEIFGEPQFNPILMPE